MLQDCRLWKEANLNIGLFSERANKHPHVCRNHALCKYSATKKIGIVLRQALPSKHGLLLPYHMRRALLHTQSPLTEDPAEHRWVDGSGSDARSIHSTSGRWSSTACVHGRKIRESDMRTAGCNNNERHQVLPRLIAPALTHQGLKSEETKARRRNVSLGAFALYCKAVLLREKRNKLIGRSCLT